MPAPNTPQDIIDRIRNLERQVRDLSGRVNIRPALNTIIGGSVTIKGGGALIVEDGDGSSVLRIGQTPPDVDGQPQQATVLRRSDGSLALSVWTDATTGPQTVRIYDKNSAVIFAEDTVAGGLAVPYLPMPNPTSDGASDWPQTTSSAFFTLARSEAFFQHPKLRISARIGLSAETSGYLRVLVGGVVVAEGDLNSGIDGLYDVPDWSWNGVPQRRAILLQGRRSAGAGAVYGTTQFIYGAQS